MAIEADFDDEMLEVEEHFQKSMENLHRDFAKVRTGRATTAMVDNVIVEAYGSTMPLKQMASITVPEPQQLLIKPWDKSVIKDIERALNAAKLGMSPQSDGSVLRLNVPPLSAERRKEMATQAKDMCEKTKVAMRNSRRDAIKAIETKGKAKKFPEDLVKKTVEEVTEMLKDYESKADAALKDKTDDLLKM